MEANLNPQAMANIAAMISRAARRAGVFQPADCSIWFIRALLYLADHLINL
jgi:hypothetical protein